MSDNSILREKIASLKHHINELTIERDAFKELSIKSVLVAGFNFDSKPYQELVRLTGVKTIILAKISKGVALTKEEKDYITNNLK